MSRGTGGRLPAYAALCALVLTAGCGDEPPPTRTPTAAQARQDELERLSDLGYAAGVVEAGPEAGVTLHEVGAAQPGVNFYVSAHGPEALLLDMEGRVLHTWEKSYWEIWPDSRAKRNDPNTRYFRRGWPDADGNLVVIFEGLGIAKLDRDSGVLWSNACQAHHDAEILPSGEIWVLTRYWRQARRGEKAVPVLVDFLTLLDTEGQVARQISLLDAIVASPYAELWTESPVAEGDVFHTNAFELLDGRAASRAPEFRAGRALVSMRNLSALAVVDLEQERLVWAHQGTYAFQHDPRILDDGRLLLFDNLGTQPHSRVLELDPGSMEVLWSYAGSEERPFYSLRCGTSQRLANGNTLITESGPGRVFETTPEGRTVWRFVNPGRAANKPRLRARIFDLMRLPVNFGAAWAQGSTQDR